MVKHCSCVRTTFRTAMYYVKINASRYKPRAITSEAMKLLDTEGGNGTERCRWAIDNSFEMYILHPNNIMGSRSKLDAAQI